MAVIGAGGIGSEHLRALAAGVGGHLVAVCDSSEAAARAAADEAADRGPRPEVFRDAVGMLEAADLDVVHVTTPPASHVPLAREALRRGIHVLVEKPLAASPEELEELLELARANGAHLLEDYNYLFNSQVRTLLAWRDEGRLGDVVHVDVTVALDVLTGGGPLVQGTAPHFALGLPAGLVSDFLPHLASLAHAFTGPATGVATAWAKRHPSRLAVDEMRCLVTGSSATASLAFSASAQPDVFSVVVEGTRMRARADLYGTGVVRSELRGAPGPLVPLLNGLDSGRREAVGAVGGLLRKISGGPGAYEGLWGLAGAFHAALRDGTPPPVSLRDVAEVNALVTEIERSAPR
ncbi:Gfo/Idh/MocA family oxidoreductase [Pseudokineococcus marinus]|uniref:Gfo/Idh/MocA family oxidoreductase n=1 Tax=Pseudokineococcus marinus TaxID=351215 RepID=A0A849BKQ6_9ACTN|nr:Gfo/Idh/MocA family oxidoreductase [Pseudokineococcus marinus]NNH21883.1 Gfo/Idh/MocA family oxidoreductase [Pseudokineococcus marinus]